MRAEPDQVRLTAWSGGLVVVLAIVARLANLGGFSMGPSEIAYVTEANDLFGAAWGSSRLADAELARRLTSVAFGVLTVGWLWRWTLQRWGWMPALFVGLLQAVSPLHVRYSQEIGPYAMGTFFAVVAVSSADRWLESPTRRRLLHLGLALAGTALSWPLLLVVLGPTMALLGEGSLLAGRAEDQPRRRLAVWFSAALLVALTTAGVLAARLEPAGGHDSPPSTPRANAVAVTQRLEELTLGARERQEPPTLTGTLAVVLVLLGAGAALRTTTGRAVVGGAFAGTVGIEAVLWFHPDPPPSRHLLGGLFLLLLIALGTHRAASAVGTAEKGGFRRIASATVALALVATVVTAQSSRLWQYYAQGRPQWEWIARVVESVTTPADEIVATNDSARVALDHYLGANGARLSSRLVALDDDSHDVALDRPGACTVVVGREAPAARTSRRSGGRWLQVAADGGTGIRVYVSGGPARRDCLRTPPLALRKGPGGPLRWMLPARKTAEDDVLEFDAASRPHLVYGWSRFEVAEGKTFVWVEGRNAAVDLDLRARGDRLLVVDLWPLAVPERQQTVEIQVNDALVTSATLNPLGERLTVEIPAGVLRDGENRIAFAFRYAARPRQVNSSPRDRRHLAVAFDRLEVR